MKKAVFIAIGDELLRGYVTDTNSSFAFSLLEGYDVEISGRFLVSDSVDEIVKYLKFSIEDLDADLIITSGGLGGTLDDVTRRAYEKAFEISFVLNDKILSLIKSKLEEKNIEISEYHVKQSYIPENSIFFENSLGLSPCFLVDYKGKYIIALPGVKREFEECFKNRVLPYLVESGFIIPTYRVLKFGYYGLRESQIDRFTKEFLGEKNVKFGIYSGVVGRVVIKFEHDLSEDDIKEIYFKYRSKYPDNILDYGFLTLEENVAYLLKNKKLSISTAESCTSGGLAYALTKIPGSSEYFLGGVNTYSNESKVRLLNVSKGSLDSYGAVSKEVAFEMVKGCRELFGSDLAVSITGIAGPGGGSKEKPVGLVYMGFSFEDIFVDKNVFSGNREEIRQKTIAKALNTIRLLVS